MAASIILGVNRLGNGLVRNDSSVEPFLFDAFGEMLHAVLSGKCQDIFEKITQSDVFNIYNFDALNDEEFNVAVRLIDQYVGGKTPETHNEELVWNYWKNFAKPFIHQDPRFQAG
ncbi:hypothetical protein [Mitsuaria sp. GD03876]|uniref:hypothetical protein n=1 Tax=Mitsuaria sp. GD03876 TaxID=2975399 RepID=UPI00244735B4|nr:hypothetical protein [Mitsuaria sp. GD03876]MDH0864658.1 hypothetical protein [Mitsuaria sp. GD03876]